MTLGLIGVTGAEGFIGSHLVEQLLKDGYKVRALVQYNSDSSVNWLSEACSGPFASRLEVVFGDVRDQGSVSNFVKGCSRVAHLAALISIPYSYVAPRSYVDTNVTGTLNVLTASLEHNVARVIVTSTSEVYGSAQFVPMNEAHPLVGQSPYSASKIAADQLAYSFFSSFGLGVVILRPFNNFGPRQSERAVIPTIIRQVQAGNQRLRLGRIDTTRDFTYVSDTARAFVSVLESDLGAGETFNFGSGFEVSVRETAELIAEFAGLESIEFLQDNERMRPETSEVTRLFCDASKFRETFSPTLATGRHESFSEGLLQTFNWYEKSSNWKTHTSWLPK